MELSPLGYIKTTMNPSIHSSFRIVREAGEPLGLFYRVGRSDHLVLKQLLSEDRIGMLGAVFDPCNCGCQEELRAEFVRRNLDAILDPALMELATVGGHTRSRRELSWASPQPHVPAQFDGAFSKHIAEQIAQFVAENRFTAVLAPSHYLNEGTKDPWLQIDKRLVVNLRERLDANGCGDVAIYYPLALSTKIFTDAPQRNGIKAALGGLPIDALWLRTHPFGSESGDTTLRRYIQACQDLHGLGLPLISEKTGVLGLALLAFGAASGIESGIGSGEKFDYARLKHVRIPNGKFGKTVRVYLPDLGGFLTGKEAAQFFEHRGLRQFACRDSQCCQRGLESMIGSGSRRHFAFQRMDEVAKLSRVTPSMRPTEYLERILRPATDHIGRALAHEELPGGVKKKLEKSRRKQDRWRATLGEMSRAPIKSFSAPIERRIHRARATA